MKVCVDDNASMFVNLICDCTSVSPCKEKYASLFENLISCLLCQVIDEFSSSFANVQCIVQNKM